MEYPKPNTWERTLAQSDSKAGFLQNGIVQILLLFSCIPIVGCVALLAYFIRPADTSIILHYNVYFGVDLIGLWWQAYILPVLAIFFVVGHFLLARYFYERAERIACYLMLFSSGMLTAGVLVSGIGVAFINY